MILRKLELYGFKSFADRQVITFAPGITAVIGPNGCGKSNVVDAFKWILGEQAPSSLRSKGMSDVLFVDREGREAVPYAEGSITFDNADGLLNFDAPEVVLTRRLHVDGRSEYLVNSRPVRLRMIRDLLMGTGIGTRSYFVLEQGRITEIIKRSPIERRAIFEEAAGIGRYNQRRREAERKLVSVEDNLVRAQDVIREIARQIRSLRIQAGRARSFNECAQRLREVRVRSSVIRFHMFGAELEAIEARLGAGQREEETARAAEEKAVQLRESSHRLREKAAQAVQRYGTNLEENTRKVEEWRASVEQELSRAAGFRAEADEKVAESARLAERLEERRGERETLEGRLEEARRARRIFATLRLVKAEELDDAERALARHETAMEDIRQEAYDAERERVQLANHIGRVRVDRGSLEGSRDRLVKRAGELEAQIARLGAVRRSAEELSEQMTSTLAEAQEALHQAESDRDAARERQTAVDRKIAEDRVLLKERRGRLTILQDLEARHEGMGEGARYLLEAGAAPSVSGLLGDRLQMDPAHVRAIERAFGSDVEALLTDGMDAALGAVETLKEHGKGGAVFWIEEPGEAPARPGDVPAAGGDIVGWAPDLVSSATHAGAVRVLLGDVVVVTDRNAALRLRAAAWARRFRLVTIDGEIFGPAGRLVGGETVQGGGLISRRVQIEQLAEEIESLDQALRALEEERPRVQAALNAAQEAAARAQEHLRSRDHDRVKQVKEVDDLRRREIDLEEEHKVGFEEAAEIGVELDRLKADERALEERLGTLEKRLEERQRDGQRTQVRRDDVARRVEALRSEAERVEAVCVAAGRRVDEVRNARHQMVERIAELDHGRQRMLEEAEGLREWAARNEEGAVALEARIVEANAAEPRWKSLLGQAGEELDRADVHLKEALSEEEGARGALDGLRQKREDDRIRQGELRTRLESLVERLRSDEGVDLVSLATDPPLAAVTADTDADTGDEAGEPLEPAALLETLDEESTRLKRKLDRLGPVNAQAIQELEGLEKRETFYRSQEEDLVESKKQLEDIIRRINKRSKQIFLETFQAIRNEFRAIFRKLFGGGRGDLRLLDEENVLESGVEIVAQPPEKGAKSIDMLSGGEKVMTTTALLFAIFTARPSPFCLLDEIDAALDEANIQRFLDMLEGFVERTQFIIVTHNKRTISRADVIHGITMPKAGRSQRMSVQFDNGVVKTEATGAPAFALDA